MTFCLLVLRVWLNKAFRVVGDAVRQTPPRHGLANSKMEAIAKTVCYLILKKGMFDTWGLEGPFSTRFIPCVLRPPAFPSKASSE